MSTMRFVNIRLLASLTALALLAPAHAAATPKLTGTLLVFSFQNSDNDCTSGYSAYNMASNSVASDERKKIYNRVGCPLELATSSNGVMVASDQNQASKEGYWKAAGTVGSFDNLRQVRQDNYFADVTMSAAPNQPFSRLKAIKDAQRKKLLRSGLALSRDGSRLAFNSSTEKNFLNATNKNSVLVRTLKGDLLSTLEASIDPAWTLDGRLLVVCTALKADSMGSALCIHNLQTRAVTKLPPPPKASYYTETNTNDFEFSQPAVSPDGKQVAVTLSPVCSGCDGSYDLPMSQVWIYDLQSRKWSPALQWAPEISGVSSVAAPVWSPDGNVLAVSINSYLSFIDLKTHKLTGYTNAAYGAKVIVRPVWIK